MDRFRAERTAKLWGGLDEVDKWDRRHPKGTPHFKHILVMSGARFKLGQLSLGGRGQARNRSRGICSQRDAIVTMEHGSIRTLAKEVRVWPGRTTDTDPRSGRCPFR